MSILARQISPNISIASPMQVVSYLRPAADGEVIVLVQVILGETLPIAGGGSYKLIIKIDGQTVSPISNVNVAVGDTSTRMQSREVSLDAGELLTVEVSGQALDSSVSVEALVQDATPIRRQEFDEIRGLSPTTVEVNHNYGGLDNYSYQTGDGRGIDNATVIAYLKSDFNAGRRSRDYHKAVTTTDVAGQWVRPMLLDPAEYVLYYYKQGCFGPDTAALTVVQG